MIKPIIIANWKVNNLTYKESEKNILETYKNIQKEREKINLIFAPSVLHIAKLGSSVLKKYKPRFAAQDVSVIESGSFTGEISPVSLKDINTNLVIIGHSERRSIGEHEEMLAKKVEVTLNNKMEVILCVGENKRDDKNMYLDIIERQITSVFSKIDKTFYKNIIIAYEPVWAVNNSNNQAMDSKTLHSMVIHIRKILIDNFGSEYTKNVRILYGGSVNEENVQDIFWNGQVQGLLIGRASVESKSLSQIIKKVLINPNKNILKNYAKKRSRINN